jgi:hypothetical protein
MVLRALALSTLYLDNTEYVLFVNNKGHLMFFIRPL